MGHHEYGGAHFVPCFDKGLYNGAAGLVKDGMIYRQLEKTGNQGEFQDQLLEVIREMSELEVSL